MNLSHSFLQFQWLLDKQRKILLKRCPALEPFFLPIYFPDLNSELPFLPINVWREFLIYSGKKDANENDCRVFYSSGSTSVNQATNLLSSEGIGLYAQGTCAGLQNFFSNNNIPKNAPILSLVPTITEWPHSSLAAMLHMFAQSGQKVDYINTNLPSRELFITLATSLINYKTTDVILFGTSLHHLIIAQKLQELGLQVKLPNIKLHVIDTGGTKGRTQYFTPGEIYTTLEKCYFTEHPISIYSEYGMCELASQAWSAAEVGSVTNPLGNVFCCNNTLIPLAIDLQFTKQSEKLITSGEVLPANLPGFLGFLDGNNTDSYSALITEDIGYTANNSPTNKLFTLLGRSPDASVKGCSLNIRDNFIPYSNVNSSELSDICFNEEKNKFYVQENFIDNIIRYLAENIQSGWDEFSLKELTFSLVEVKNYLISHKKPFPPLNAGEHFQNNLLIVASANMPIVWLYPAIVAIAKNYAQVVIQLPSMRKDDVLAQKVRRQTQSLIQALVKELQINSLQFIDSVGILFTKNIYRKILVFGTDATVKVFKENYKGSSTDVIGMGEVFNAANVNLLIDAPEKIAHACANWYGRGCLTPLVLFLPNEISTAQSWVTNFSDFYEQLFTEQLQEHNFGNQTCELNLYKKHIKKHGILRLTARIKALQLNLLPLLNIQENTIIVDLRFLKIPALKKIIDLNLAGSGLVYLCRVSQQRYFKHSLSFVPSDPCITDPHCGIKWEDVLN